MKRRKTGANPLTVMVVTLAIIAAISLVLVESVYYTVIACKVQHIIDGPHAVVSGKCK